MLENGEISLLQVQSITLTKNLKGEVHFKLHLKASYLFIL